MHKLPRRPGDGSGNAGSAQIPQVTIDPAGNPIAVWQQSDGAWANIWANRSWK